MNHALKSLALVATSGPLLLLTGCETLRDAAEAPAFAEAPTSRAQVVAELQEARRLGLIPHGEADIPEMSDQQVRLVAAAGAKAASSEQVARK